MSDTTTRKLTPRDNLQVVYALVDAMMELEGQDRDLVLEMSQCMINDLIERGELNALHNYVLSYCDVLDSTNADERREEAKAISEGI
jgi:hypothetical protein